jgi:hypothetical protein
MFFQYNPQAAVWGDMSWNHAISPDMIHWTHLPVAMTPTPGGPDSFGCFSGSAMAVGKRVYFIYTGVRESTPDKATIRDGSDKLQESQCLAYCDAQSDPKLIRWIKLPQPIVPAPPPGLNITGFRDPSVWKQGDSFYMTVGSGIAKIGGAVLLYRSKDLRQWTYLHMLTSGTWNGRPAANPCDSGEMWECPEFFPLDGGHVLIYSTEGKVFWQSGALNPETMVFTAAKTGELDLGAFYAPKTQLDASGQRILWGWIPERRPEQQFSAARKEDCPVRTRQNSSRSTLFGRSNSWPVQLADEKFGWWMAGERLGRLDVRLPGDRFFNQATGRLQQGWTELRPSKRSSIWRNPQRTEPVQVPYRHRTFPCLWMSTAYQPATRACRRQLRQGWRHGTS